MNKRNLFNICLQVTHPTDSYIIRIHFYYVKKVKNEKKWKMKIFD